MASDDLLILRDALRLMIVRELRSLDREIAAYPDDASLWQTRPGISNSGGNLALHMVGNLRHFIGAVLGDTGYVRDRDAEFAIKGRSRDELRAEVQTGISELGRAFDRIDSAQLKAEYPLLLRDRRVRTADFLVHLSIHLGYHLGQVNYHRRLLTPNPKAVDALSILELTAYVESPRLS